MAVPRTIFGLASVAMLIQLAMATGHTVGGTNGWDTSTDLQTWVASQKFAVGDSLIFQYTPNHNVLEVPKADYDSCQTNSPIETYSDGNTIITLSAPGKKYFICGTFGHCIQGMKIEVDTQATSTSPAPKTSPSPANSPESAQGSPSPSPGYSPSPNNGTPPSSANRASLQISLTIGVGLASSDVPSTESPGNSPSPHNGTPPSSANRASLQTSLTLGVGLVLMVLLAL